MQKLEAKKIFVPEGYIFLDVWPTPAGEEKIENCYYDSMKEAEWEDVDFLENRSVQDVILDMFSEASATETHPVCKIDGMTVELIEGVDYTIDIRSEEAFELSLIAERLEDLHKVMQEEMDRLGW